MNIRNHKQFRFSIGPWHDIGGLVFTLWEHELGHDGNGLRYIVDGNEILFARNIDFLANQVNKYFDFHRVPLNAAEQQAVKDALKSRSMYLSGQR